MLAINDLGVDNESERGHRIQTVEEWLRTVPLGEYSWLPFVICMELGTEHQGCPAWVRTARFFSLEERYSIFKAWSARMEMINNIDHQSLLFLWFHQYVGRSHSITKLWQYCDGFSDFMEYMLTKVQLQLLLGIFCATYSIDGGLFPIAFMAPGTAKDGEVCKIGDYFARNLESNYVCTADENSELTRFRFLMSRVMATWNEHVTRCFTLFMERPYCLESFLSNLDNLPCLETKRTQLGDGADLRGFWYQHSETYLKGNEYVRANIVEQAILSLMHKAEKFSHQAVRMRESDDEIALTMRNKDYPEDVISHFFKISCLMRMYRFPDKFSCSVDYNLAEEFQSVTRGAFVMSATHPDQVPYGLIRRNMDDACVLISVPVNLWNAYWCLGSIGHINLDNPVQQLCPIVLGRTSSAFVVELKRPCRGWLCAYDGNMKFLAAVYTAPYTEGRMSVQLIYVKKSYCRMPFGIDGDNEVEIDYKPDFNAKDGDPFYHLSQVHFKRPNGDRIPCLDMCKPKELLNNAFLEVRTRNKCILYKGFNYHIEVRGVDHRTQNYTFHKMDRNYSLRITCKAIIDVNEPYTSLSYPNDIKASVVLIGDFIYRGENGPYVMPTTELQVPSMKWGSILAQSNRRGVVGHYTVCPATRNTFKSDFNVIVSTYYPGLESEHVQRMGRIQGCTCTSCNPSLLMELEDVALPPLFVAADEEEWVYAHDPDISEADSEEYGEDSEEDDTTTMEDEE